MAVAASLPLVEPAWGQQAGRGEQPPVYQRHAGYGRQDWNNKGRGRSFAPTFPPISSGSFTRPYPYHLDFYRMKYGGSYAPYFGNLYGPPQVVTAPPYYGPYYGGGWAPEAGGFPANGGDGGAPFGATGYSGVVVSQDQVQQQTNPSNQPSASSNGENLPTPSR